MNKILKHILNIFMIIFIVIPIILLGIWCFLKYSKPPSILPNENYIGMTRLDVLNKLLNENKKDTLSGKILINIPMGRTIEIDKHSITKEIKDYLFSKSQWNVNYLYSKNNIKGGYYYYKLDFNKYGIVEKQKKAFQSDIGYFGL